jgi:hypothetical protein
MADGIEAASDCVSLRACVVFGTPSRIERGAANMRRTGNCLPATSRSSGGAAVVRPYIAAPPCDD